MDPLLTFIIVSAVVLGGSLFSGLLILAGIRKLKNSVLGEIVSGISRELSDSNRSILDVDLTPPSEPKSVSDMSSALIPSIAKDFPDLNIRQLISACEHLLTLTLREIGVRSGGSDSAERALFSDGTENEALPLPVTGAYRQTILDRVEDLRKRGKSEHFSGMKIHRTGIRSYEKTAGTREITFQTALEYFHVIKQNGNVVSGNPNTPEQARYRISVIYVVDDSKLPLRYGNAIGMVCPNCGAAAKTVGFRHCLYCGVELTPVDVRLWRVDKITEE